MGVLFRCCKINAGIYMCVECFSSRDCLAWLSITATSLMSMIFSKVCSSTTTQHSLRGGSDRRGCSVSKYAVPHTML